MKTKDIITIGLCVLGVSALGYGGYVVAKISNEQREERERQRQEFENYKEIVMKEMQYLDLVRLHGIANPALNEEDGAYAYSKLKNLYHRLAVTTSKEEFNKVRMELDDMLGNLGCGRPVTKPEIKAINSYVAYLKAQDTERKEKKEREALLAAERQRSDSEKEIMKMKIDAEKEHTDAIVESIKAIANAGKTDSSDVNVTINNSKED